MSIQNIKNNIRNIPNYPKIGIQFKDITTAIKQPKIFREIIDLFFEYYKDKQIDYVIGIESRGFIFASVLAYVLDCSFVPIRKSGKLPAEVISQEYELEYGTDKIELHADALKKDDKVLIIDDLLATGGTALAAAELVKKTGAKILGFAFMIELEELKAKEKLEKYAPVLSLIKY